MYMGMAKASTIVIFVVLVFVSLFIYTKVAGPIPFLVNNINTNKETPFEVSGTGKAAAAPDTAVINLGVTTNSSTVLDAQNKTNQVSSKIVDSLKNLGIEEKNIKTTSYTVSPDYSFSGEIQRITGYSVSQNFEVKTPINKANKVIDGATTNGANLIGGITFTLDDNNLEDIKNKAREEAVSKAKASAQGLAKAAGVRLGKIISIRESFGGGPIVLPLAREGTGGDLQKETNITPGENNVEVTVTLTYETL